MVRFKTGDILAEDAEALVNTVNCVGVMGRGIALQFKKAFPENFHAYKAACGRGDVQPGRMFVFETDQLANPRYIVNFPTKRHWRGNSLVKDIETGLEALVDVIRERSIRSIAVPPLGSGLGGLAWSDVRPRIESALCGIEGVEVVVFEPAGAPEAHVMVREREAARMSSGRAALICLMERYSRPLLDPYITLLEVHKLMYFLQVAGQPVNLKFEKGPYGPYSSNLRHVMNKIEGHFISGYADGGDYPFKPLELLPNAVELAERILEGDKDTRRRLERVAGLVEGFESEYGLELLSAVHWVLEHEVANRPDLVVEQTHAWNERKRRFTRRQIRLAADVLNRGNWVRSAAAGAAV